MNSLIKLLPSIFISLILATFVACSGSKETGDSSSSGASSIFVGEKGTSGGLRIELVEDRFPVAETAGFFVKVVDSTGASVSNIGVVCDTENALALIEPNQGNFITDKSGSASGRLGCNAPGSFQIGCRLDGGNARHFATVVCTGSAPVGFTGFTGAGGGGLGNGVADIADEEDVNDSVFTVRVIDVDLMENGQSTTSIDLNLIPDCDGEPDSVDPEPFTDTSINFTISNNTEQIARITGYRYTVGNFDGSGASYTSPILNLIGESLGQGQTGTFSGLFADAGGTGQKFFFGLGTPITSTGFKNITYELVGELADGTSISIEASDAASFDFFNRC